MGLVLLILLILLLVGAFQGRGDWGAAPGGVLGLLLIILLVLIILGHVPVGF
jgi:hypothetical protein